MVGLVATQAAHRQSALIDRSTHPVHRRAHQNGARRRRASSLRHEGRQLSYPLERPRPAVQSIGSTAYGDVMFLDLFYGLRDEGVPVALQEWMTLIEALREGLHG